MASKVTKGELMERAEEVGIDPEQSYQDLRDQIEIYTCKHCGDENLSAYSEKFCTDGCEVAYRNKYY